jgi:hypothetical protein
MLTDQQFQGLEKQSIYWVERAKFEEDWENFSEVVRLYEHASDRNSQVMQ